MCQGGWWKHLLYIQNFFTGNDKLCFGWSWYIANDYLYYILSPLIIFPLFIRPVVGYLVVTLFFLMTSCTPLALTFIHYYSPIFGFTKIADHSQTGEWLFQFYDAPWCRMGPYLEGLMLGYVIYRTKHTHVHVHWFINLTCWVLAIATGASVVFGLYPYMNGTDIDLVVAALYNSLARVAWDLSLCWVIFSCIHGTEGGVVNSLLSLPVWVPLGRLTYAVYLTHPFVLAAVFTSTRKSVYFDDMTLSVLYVAILVGCYVVGFVATLLFESPIMALESIVLRKYRKK